MGCGCCAAIMESRLLVFLTKGPHFIVITGQEAAAEEALQESLAAVAEEETAPVTVEISLSQTKAAPPAKLAPCPTKGVAAYRCTSALGSELRNRHVKDFNKSKQTYQRSELSLLPFQPPAFWEHAVAMLTAATKVANYVITVLVALMLIQDAVSKYKDTTLDSWQAIVLFLFAWYPAVTLGMIVLTNNEMVVRRFIYYRLMSLQIIVDWDNKPTHTYCFFSYFATTTILLNAYGVWGFCLTYRDGMEGVGPKWSLIAMQSLLIAMFWYSLTQMEVGLISLNKVIENSPQAAKDLISNCEVVTEGELKRAIRGCYKRAKAFKRLSREEQDRQRLELATNGNSDAAFFDLITLRECIKGKMAVQASTEDAAVPGCLEKVSDWCNRHFNPFHKMYALEFALACFDRELQLLINRLIPGRRVQADAVNPVSWWPYHDDYVYLSWLGALGLATVIWVECIEGYAIWLIGEAVAKTVFKSSS